MPTIKFVYPYRSGSNSARALAEAIRARRIRLEGSTFRPNERKIVINWGSTEMPQNYVELCGKVYNPPSLVRRASNKLLFLQANAENENGARVPEWTTDKEVARQWWADREDQLVFARTALAAHSGEGIVKLQSPADLDQVRDGTLLVKYIKKAREYRVHVGTNDARGYYIIDVQQKRRRTEVPDEEVDWQIRNHQNGFIYARENIVLPEDAGLQAIRALQSTGLDFGAVDVIWNDRHEEAYVLEVNTAPGLEGTTVENYANYFNS